MSDHYLGNDPNQAVYLRRGTLTGPTVTPDLYQYASYDWALSSGTPTTYTLSYPVSVPATGVWYIDAAVGSVGGHTLSLGIGYSQTPGFYFDSLPNTTYRFWLVSKGGSSINVSVERL